MLECFEQEGPVVDRRNTDLLVCAPSGVALRCSAQGKADRMSAWRTGRWPVFLILPMPTGAAESPIELRWQAARLPYRFLIPMPHWFRCDASR